MCGIFGLMTGSKANLKADDVVKDSFVAGSLRGMDSCGVAAVDMMTAEYEWQKLPVNGSTFITDKAALSIMRDGMRPNTLTLAHTRAATHGRVSLNNAHPFIVEGQGTTSNYRELVGIHNGSLTGWASRKGASKFDVDSEWAFHQIFDEGENAFTSFQGAYCFVWWDSEDKETLNISLNDQRPMHIAFLKDGGMAFASEAGMLAWLLERNGVERDGNILVLSSNFHYKFDVSDPKSFSKKAIKSTALAAVGTKSWGNRKTAMQLVEELLSKVKADGTDVHKPFVSKDEVDRAAMEGMQGLKGKFTPSFLDTTTGELSGTVEIENPMQEGDFQEMIATIRNATRLSWDADYIFDVSVLGVADDPTNTIVLSWPSNLMNKTAQVA